MKVDESSVRCEEETAGGSTYFIKKEDGNEVSKCFRHLRKNDDKSKRCGNPAGFKTWHSGTGACYLHGGGGREEKLHPRITNAKQAYATRRRLDDKIQEYLQNDRDQLLDMNYELAATKVIFQEFLNTYPDPTDENYGTFLFRHNQLISSLSNLVEKISRIETRNTLTAAQVLYLKATVADLFMKYIPDPIVRERAAKELQSRVSGDETELKPTEVRFPQGVDVL